MADPYRWLEDDTAVSPAVASWVEAENSVTFAYLEKIPYRAKIKERLTQLYNYPKYSAPARRGDYFYFTKNDGLQNQSVWYRQKGLDGTPEVLLDPNKLSADGTTRLGGFALSKNGKYVAYGVSKGGSDWNDVYVMDVNTKQSGARARRVDEGVRYLLAGRRVLLQPLSRAGKRPRAHQQERKPSGFLSQGRHVASGRFEGLRRCGESTTIP